MSSSTGYCNHSMSGHLQAASQRRQAVVGQWETCERVRKEHSIRHSLLTLPCHGSSLGHFHHFVHRRTDRTKPYNVRFSPIDVRVRNGNVRRFPYTLGAVQVRKNCTVHPYRPERYGTVTIPIADAFKELTHFKVDQQYTYLPGVYCPRYMNSARGGSRTWIQSEDP